MNTKCVVIPSNSNSWSAVAIGKAGRINYWTIVLRVVNLIVISPEWCVLDEKTPLIVEVNLSRPGETSVEAFHRTIGELIEESVESSHFANAHPEDHLTKGTAIGKFSSPSITQKILDCADKASVKLREIFVEQSAIASILK